MGGGHEAELSPAAPWRRGKGEISPPFPRASHGRFGALWQHRGQVTQVSPSHTQGEALTQQDRLAARPCRALGAPVPPPRAALLCPSPGTGMAGRLSPSRRWHQGDSRGLVTGRGRGWAQSTGSRDRTAAESCASSFSSLEALSPTQPSTEASLLTFGFHYGYFGCFTASPRNTKIAWSCGARAGFSRV